MKKQCTAILATTFLCLAQSALADTPHYSIIVDAGSSGSRVHLFEYDNHSAVPSIKEVFTENTKPGLSSYAGNPEAAGASLKQLLTDTADTLNKSHVDLKTVPISVLATAGMRLLPEDSQAAIYANVTQYIKQNFDFSIKQIETIPGKMEGVFGWLDVNYLENNLQNNLPTVGSIDVGGASTQIAFVTADTKQTDNEVDITFGNQTYHVFAKSFLGLGQDQSLAAMNKAPTANACYPLNYDTGHGKGDFNFTTCGDIYADMIKKHQVRETVLPHADQSFVLYSAAYYSFNFFDVIKNPEDAVVESRVQSVCHASWETLQQEYPKENPQILANYCANETYLEQLFFHNYDLKASQMTITNKINGNGIDWTIGALLFQLANKA
jgi:apyrase